MKTKSFTRLFVRAVWPSAHAVMCWNSILRSHIGSTLEVYWVPATPSTCLSASFQSTCWTYDPGLFHHSAHLRGSSNSHVFTCSVEGIVKKAWRNPAEIRREAKQKRISHQLRISINSTQKIIYKLNSWGSGALFIEVSAEATEC